MQYQVTNKFEDNESCIAAPQELLVFFDRLKKIIITI